MPRARGCAIRGGEETRDIEPVSTRSSGTLPTGEGSPAHPRSATETPVGATHWPSWKRRTGGRSVQEGAIPLRRELGTAKAQVVVPVRRLVGVPVRRPHVLRVVVPGTAPDHAGGRRFDRPP